MLLNPDLNKNDQEVIFSKKMRKCYYPRIGLNNVPVFCVHFQKHLKIYLDEKLNFNYHTIQKTANARKDIGVIKKN